MTPEHDLIKTKAYFQARLNDGTQCEDGDMMDEEECQYYETVLALIDYALAKPPMMDEAQLAIDQLTDLSEHVDDWGVKMGEYPTYSHGLNMGIAALRQYRKPQTKFEAWKAGLTLEGEAERTARRNRFDRCDGCPASDYCDSIPNPVTDCEERFKEWGESNADK